MAKTIIVDVVNGKATITTKGFAGRACLAATADLERALGRKVSDTHTDEMRQTTTTRTVGAGSK